MQSHNVAQRTAPNTESLPEGFDPRELPIFGQHWFGIAALLRQDGAGDRETVDVEEAA